MIKHSYFCNNCMEPYGFAENEERTTVICPICNSKMEYICSEDINDETHKLAKRWVDEERQKSHPEIKNSQPTTPTITCPYCKSTDCKKITNTSKAVHTAIFGIFSLGRNSKNYHCNSCKSDF